MKPDPSPRSNGKCAVCGKLRTKPNGKADQLKRPTFLVEWQADPFCSSRCCREFHKCAIPEDGRAGTNVGNGQGRRPTPEASRVLGEER